MSVSLHRSLFGVVVLATFAVGCSEEIPAVETASPRPVRVEAVTTRSPTVPSVLAGVAKAGVESNLSFRVSGTVDRLPIVVGQLVKKGELLGRLDPIDYELAHEEAKASLAQAEASLRQTIADYGRVRALYENNNSSKSDLDAGRAGFESAQAQVDAAQKRIAQAQQQVGYTKLRAPIAGAISEISVERNETVSAGQSILRLASGELPEIEVAVSEITIPYIHPKMSARVEFDALPGQQFEGIVSEVSVSSGRGNSTYPVTIRLQQTVSAVRPGMAAEVRFEIQPETEANIVVPAVAVGEDRHGRFVYVLDGDGPEFFARQRRVEIGEFVEEGVEILSGLEIGERLITAGVRRMVDGMTVRLDPVDSASRI